MSLLYQIESCLRATRLPPSRFGREAIRDPRIVSDLRRGRQPGPRVEKRLRSYIAKVMAGSAEKPLCFEAVQGGSQQAGPEQVR